MEEPKHISKEHETTVSAYSDNNYLVYDDPTNKNFVYGEITIDFVNSIQINPADKVIADIGCGTGFAFDILKEKIKDREGKYIGIEPAKGMLDTAIEKYKSAPEFSFASGSFDNIPLEDNSVDKLISTLALHWVPSIENAAKEINRVLRPGGTIDILMIARNDGDNFKRPVVDAMKKHLTTTQIMKAASLAQRVSATQLKKHFSTVFEQNDISVQNVSRVIYGTFDEHMKWWQARSEQIITEVQDKTAFMNDLKAELGKIDTGKGIPFDLSVLYLHLA